MRNKGIWAALVVILAVLTLRLGFWAVGGRGSVVYADAPQAGPVASQTDGALKEIRTLLPSRAIPPKGSSSSAAAGATDIPALPDVQALLQAHPAQRLAGAERAVVTGAAAEGLLQVEVARAERCADAVAALIAPELVAIVIAP